MLHSRWSFHSISASDNIALSSFVQWHCKIYMVMKRHCIYWWCQLNVYFSKGYVRDYRAHDYNWFYLPVFSRALSMVSVSMFPSQHYPEWAFSDWSHTHRQDILDAWAEMGRVKAFLNNSWQPFCLSLVTYGGSPNGENFPNGDIFSTLSFH